MQQWTSREILSNKVEGTDQYLKLASDLETDILCGIGMYLHSHTNTKTYM